MIISQVGHDCPWRWSVICTLRCFLAHTDWVDGGAASHPCSRTLCALSPSATAKATPFEGPANGVVIRR